MPLDSALYDPLQGVYSYSSTCLLQVVLMTVFSGLRVACVQAIFCIPEHYSPEYCKLVAFVKWFTLFCSELDSDTGMFKVSHSSQNHCCQVSIIWLSQIVCSCHLIPVRGKSIDCSWTSENILDCCKQFYVNPYLQHHNFILLKYLHDRKAL